MNTNFARPIAACIAALACTPLAAQEGTGWRTTRLDLDLSILPEERLLIVEGVLSLTLDAERSSGPALQMRNIVDEELVLEAEGRSGVPVDPAPSGRLVQSFRFDRAFERGAELDVHFAFTTRVERNQLVTAPDIAFASWVEYWYPTPVPADPNDARARHAPGTTTFHLPPTWRSVTNGAFVERTEDELEATEVWRCEQAVARSYAAGPYTAEWFEADGRRVGVFLLSPKPTGARDQAETLSRALEAMEARFGPYPYPTYVIAEVPNDRGAFGASSEQGFILCKPGFFLVEGGNVPLFAHEAAHGWWGNLVGTRGTGGILCSESLAQYGAALAIEGMEGADAATEFLRFSREGYIDIQCARGYFALARQGNDMPLSELVGGGWQHNLSDAKGHWVFHMVRGRLGDERFFGALRRAIDEYAGRAMSLDELREIFADADDDPDAMRRFLAQWLDRPGAPVIEAEVERDANGAQLVVRQVQRGSPYELALEIDLVDAEGGVEARVVDVVERETVVSLAADARWIEARVDPRHRLLVWTSEYGARPADTD